MSPLAQKPKAQPCLHSFGEWAWLLEEVGLERRTCRHCHRREWRRASELLNESNPT